MKNSRVPVYVHYIVAAVDVLFIFRDNTE